MTVKRQILISTFFILLSLCLFVMSIYIALSAMNHSFDTSVNIEYEAPFGVVLNFANNEGSSINIDETSVVYSDDGNQFRIDGEVPTTSTLTRSGEVTNLDNLTNNNGAEFYYFSTNSNVLTDPQNTIWEEQDRYYISTEEDPIWYEMPQTQIQLYSVFLTPNCFTGTQEDIGSNTDIIISHQVTTIPYNAFMENTAIISVIIPNSVISIDSEYNREALNGAFYGCQNLAKAIIPSSVNYVGELAFMMCTGIATNIYDSGKYIGVGENPYALLVSLTDYTISSIDIHDECISIQGVAFADMINEQPCQNLTSISIPNKVKNIGYSAFTSCLNLKNIFFEEDSELEEIGAGAFIFSTIDGEVVIPNSVREIGVNAFGGCVNLDSVVLPDGITTLEQGVFESCISLKNINIPDGVISIGERAFYECDLTSIIIPNTVTSIGERAFYNCRKLVEVINLSSLNITAGDTSNGYVGLYANYIYNDINTPLKQKRAGDYIFYLNNNTMYLLGYLGQETNLTLPSIEQIKTVFTNFTGDAYSIYYYAFYYCSSLTEIVIPESVTSIGSYAFSSCSSLTTVTIEENSQLTSIGDYVFRNCTSLTSITIPNSVTSIGYYAFSDCTSLTSITIPSSVTSIGYYAFSDCTSLTSITIPSSVTSIESYAFSDCSGLTSVVIPDSVTSIGSGVFSGCTSLTSITMPNSVTSIGERAFYGNLTIYCEIESQPSGWDSEWNYHDRPVYWANEWHYENGVPVPNGSSGDNADGN